MKLWPQELLAAFLMLAVPAMPVAAQVSIEAMPPHHVRPRPTANLAPTSAWAADFAADNCALTRSFGDANGSVTLRLRQFAPEARLEVTLASGTFELQPYEPTYAFGSGEPLEIPFYQTFEIDGGVRGVVFEALLHQPQTVSALLPFAADDPALRAVDRVAVRNVFDHGVILQTGSLGQPLTVLASCLDDLVASWGLDPAAHHTLSRPVTERDPDHPWPGQLAGRAAAVTQWPSDKMDFVLLVSEFGRISQCRLVGGSPNDAGLADRICEAMPKDWQFGPALDANGQPIRSYRLATLVKQTRTTVSGFH